MHNGVKQGCNIAPVLFSLCFSAVFDDWSGRCILSVSPWHKLVGDHASKSRLLFFNVSESMFADDAALYASSLEGFEAVSFSFIAVTKGWV